MSQQECNRIRLGVKKGTNLTGLDGLVLNTDNDRAV